MLCDFVKIFDRKILFQKFVKYFKIVYTDSSSYSHGPAGPCHKKRSRKKN